MCYRKRCLRCNKITYGGCGKHVDIVLADVPDDQLCKCAPITENDDDEDD